MLFTLSITLVWCLASVHALPTGRLIDLTYEFNNNTNYVPTHKPWQMTIAFKGMHPDGFWVQHHDMGPSNEHGGTHLDAPAHFFENSTAVHEIPLESLIAPGIVIDISAKAANNPDATIEVSDIEAWELANGGIAAGTIVLMKSGWGQYWDNRDEFLGFDEQGQMHFPGLGTEAANLLVERNIAGFGVDSASLDAAVNKPHWAHRILLGNGIWGLEMVANVNQLPPIGFDVYVLPIKTTGGTGGPTRVFAEVHPASDPLNHK